MTRWKRTEAYTTHIVTTESGIGFTSPHKQYSINEDCYFHTKAKEIQRIAEAGNAVVVGVSSTGGKGTDHYVTITGRTTYLGTGAFTFMENAVSNSANVRDFKSNLFFPNPNMDTIIGRSPHREHHAQQYSITRIQKNR